MTNETVERTEDTLPVCSSYCEHCNYAMCGDFICDITDAVTIEDWKPFPCHHPERRKLVEENEDECETKEDAQLERIEELELKIKKLKDKNKALELYADLADAKVDEVKIKLIKAKEIIRRYVKIYVNPYPEEEIELRNEAEKFLKEEENENTN